MTAESYPTPVNKPFNNSALLNEVEPDFVRNLKSLPGREAGVSPALAAAPRG
jgi:hypothetical protein